MHHSGEPSPTATQATPSTASLSSSLFSARSADECLALAEAADTAADLTLQRSCLERAVALDRNCQTALLTLAALSMEENEPAATFTLLEEAARVSPLPESVDALHQALHAEVGQDARIENYLRAIGRIAPTQPVQKLSVVLITNLFPPQELGGYGRMMWEFAQGLVARGHSVVVLTANETAFAKPATPDEIAMESRVRRTLQLLGTWKGGRQAVLEDQAEIARRVYENTSRIRTAVVKSRADLILAGNLDLIGWPAIQAVLKREIPILHALANANPGYAVAEQPLEPHYWVAPCSDWNGEVFTQAGYAPARVETLYPGARIDRFFRLFLPDTRQLRICYASLVLPYKGAHILVQALGHLHRAGFDFSAEIAGDAPDPDFLEKLQAVIRTNGMQSKVRFTGFLDRQDLSALFARNNVLVFPSQFAEPFGISQVEAMAAGLVVVTSATGGAREIVGDGVNGLHFSPASDRDLAEKLAALVRDPERFSRLQRGAQARAAALSVEKAVLKIEKLADELISPVAAPLAV